MAEPAAPPPSRDPRSMREERLGALGLWLVVLLQVAIPLSYYGWRGDPEDERFAWRMFSSLRLRRCQLSAVEWSSRGAQPIHLPGALHASWISSLQRGRRPVIERFLRTRCERSAASRVQLQRRCLDVGRRVLPPRRYQYDCAAGRLTIESP